MLFVISTGTKTAYNALTEFVRSISQSEIEAVTKDEHCRFWFRAGQSNPSVSTSGDDVDMEEPELRNLDTDMLPPPADQWHDPEPKSPTPEKALPQSHIPQTQPTPPPPNTSQGSDREPSPSPSNLAQQRERVVPDNSHNGHPGQVPKLPPPNTQQESGEGSALPHPHSRILQPRTAPRQPPPPLSPSKSNTRGSSQKKKNKVDVPEWEETIVKNKIFHYFVSESPCSVPVPF